MPTEWRMLPSLLAYKRYVTGREDVVGFRGDPCIHTGNLAYVMSGRAWLHTLCGITYAVYPDPLTKDLRHDVALLGTRAGGMHCLHCEGFREDE